MSSSPPLRTPRAYHRGAWARFTEGLRYGGGIGQWSWLIHRVTGLGVLAFLVLHIIDTFLVVVSPADYDWTVDIYGGVFSGTYYWILRWLFRFAELGLIACVLFHSVNGVRIVLFDFWPGSSDHQRRIFWIAMIVFGVIMLWVSWEVLKALAGPAGHAMPLQ